MAHTPTWHTLAEADERAWLDQWARGLINPTTLEPAAPARPEPVLAGATR
ncbi:hypothetical protein ACIQHU_38935 [Streptomyces tendae]